MPLKLLPPVVVVVVIVIMKVLVIEFSITVCEAVLLEFYKFASLHIQ